MAIELDEVVEMDADATLPFSMDWSEWLTEEGDTFDTGLTPVITIDPSGALAVESEPEPIYTSAGLVTWWMAGGTAGVTYDVTVTVTTSGGRVDERTAQVAVVER